MNDADQASAKLSLAISDLVSRGLAGEALDVPTEALRLAMAYPELGVSGPMIESAVARATGMIGSIRAAAADRAAHDAGPADGAPADPPQSEDAAVAATGEPVEAPPRAPLQMPEGMLTEPLPAVALPPPAMTEAAAAPLPGLLSRVSRRPVAAVRRALFRG